MDCRCLIARFRQQCRAVLILGEAGIDKREDRRQRRRDRGHSRGDGALLERAAGVDADVGLAEVTADLDGRAQAHQARLLGVTLDGKIQFLGAEARVATARDEHVLGVDDDMLRVQGAVLDCKLRHAAAHFGLLVALQQQAHALGDVDAGQLGEGRAHFPVRQDHRQPAVRIREHLVHRIARALDYRARLQLPGERRCGRGALALELLQLDVPGAHVDVHLRHGAARIDPGHALEVALWHLQGERVDRQHAVLENHVHGNPGERHAAGVDLPGAYAHVRVHAAHALHLQRGVGKHAQRRRRCRRLLAGLRLRGRFRLDRAGTARPAAKHGRDIRHAQVLRTQLAGDCRTLARGVDVCGAGNVAVTELAVDVGNGDALAAARDVRAHAVGRSVGQRQAREVVQFRQILAGRVHIKIQPSQVKGFQHAAGGLELVVAGGHGEIKRIRMLRRQALQRTAGSLERKRLLVDRALALEPEGTRRLRRFLFMRLQRALRLQVPQVVKQFAAVPSWISRLRTTGNFRGAAAGALVGF